MYILCLVQNYIVSLFYNNMEIGNLNDPQRKHVSHATKSFRLTVLITCCLHYRLSFLSFNPCAVIRTTRSTVD